MKTFYSTETEEKLFKAESYEDFSGKMIELKLSPDAVFDMFPTEETYSWYEKFNEEATQERHLPA